MNQVIDGVELPFSKNFFNVGKNDYGKTEIFLGQAPGIIDSINVQYPDIHALYKNLKTLDWDENEWDYASCANDFLTKPAGTVRKLLKNLGYQWELDSFASRISAVVALFDPCTEVWAAWQRISDNEVVHGLTYSEIVRTALPNPGKVMNEILDEIASLKRLETLGREMSAIIKRGHEYQLGLVPNDQETYNHAFMFTFLLLILERVQFMSSFATTFAICDDGSFAPIGRGIQRICQDEWEIHTEMDWLALKHMLATERGQTAYKQLKSRMESVLAEVIQSEVDWSHFLFKEDTEEDKMNNLSESTLNEWVYYSGHAIAKPLGLNVDFPSVQSNPLSYMTAWVKISDVQQSPQEESVGTYKTNTVTRDDEDDVYEL